MKIGEVIRKYRKEKHMTQEEMANRLGVTTPAVNKWENSVSLPDITMLLPIARLLGISVDTLLSFREELTEEECRDILNRLWERLNGGDFEQAFQFAKDRLKEYPSCHGLMLWMAQALEAYFVVMPRHQTAETEAFVHSCYERALESEEEAVRVGAADALYTHELRNENYEAAEGYLRYFSMENPERKRKQALLYSKTGRLEDACRAYEELLYAGCQIARMVLQSLYNIAVQQGETERAQFLIEKHTALIGVYDMGDYAEAAAVLDHAVQTQDAELTIETVKRVLGTVDTLDAFTKSPLYAHMQFNPMESGMEERLRNKLKQTLGEDERFVFLAGYPAWESLIA